MSLHGLYLEDIKVGMTAVYAKTITDADIVMFSGVSGDTNPVHLDHDFAVKTMFKGRIAHGMLAASLLSTIFGTKLPGPGCIYLSQNLRFRAPVRIGDTVRATVTAEEVITDKKRVRFSCLCKVGDTVVIDGEAMIMVSSKAALAEKMVAA